MDEMLKGNDDGVIAENVRMLKGRGFDEIAAMRMAHLYAQGSMSDVTQPPPTGTGPAPKPLTGAAPSERPITADDETAEPSDDEKAEGE